MFSVRQKREISEGIQKLFILNYQTEKFPFYYRSRAVLLCLGQTFVIMVLFPFQIIISIMKLWTLGRKYFKKLLTVVLIRPIIATLVQQLETHHENQTHHPEFLF